MLCGDHDTLAIDIRSCPTMRRGIRDVLHIRLFRPYAVPHMTISVTNFTYLASREQTLWWLETFGTLVIQSKNSKHAWPEVSPSCTFCSIGIRKMLPRYLGILHRLLIATLHCFQPDAFIWKLGNNKWSHHGTHLSSIYNTDLPYS